jgi:hypothetical protein
MVYGQVLLGGVAARVNGACLSGGGCGFVQAEDEVDRA